MGNFYDKLIEYKEIRDKYIEEYKKIKKKKISLIGKCALITAMMAASALIIANTLNLTCGTCMAIALYIPLSKTCKQLDILRQKQKEIKRNLPTIDSLIEKPEQQKPPVQSKITISQHNNTMRAPSFDNTNQQLNPEPTTASTTSYTYKKTIP